MQSGLTRLSDLVSSLGQTREAKPIGVDEIRARVRQVTRLLAAWPNARPANTDATLLEYMNATRGVPLGSLPQVISAAIAHGGEFIPPAGAILERAAKHLASLKERVYNPGSSMTEREEWDRCELVSELHRAQRGVLPLIPSDLGRAKLGSGNGGGLLGDGGAAE